MRGLGEATEGDLGLEVDKSLIADIAKSHEHTLPVGDGRAAVGAEGEGEGVVIVDLIGIMDMERLKSVPQSADGVLHMLAAQVGVSHVKAEGKDLLACDGIELVNVFASLTGIGTGAVKNAGARTAAASPHIFKADLDAEFFCLFDKI